MNKRRFILPYFIIALYGITMLSAAIYTGATGGKGIVYRPRLAPISNSSSPAAMDKHFNQHPWKTIPASSLGLPDGTCYAYGNKVSWLVLQCFGAQPEVKP